ncbi:MAG: indolepyruvate ferredoxin oxidoreductase subunit alpha [Bacillota bacterium]
MKEQEKCLGSIGGDYAHRTFDKYAGMDVLIEEPGRLCVLSGNEACARGAIEAGVSVATSYPGSPTTYILDSLSYAAKKWGFHAEWSVNEKVGFEVALGAAQVGRRAMHITKNVGMSWLMDPLICQRGFIFPGALVIVIGDDPEANTTSVEMDCRWLAVSAEVPILVPSTMQEVKDYTIEAFRISEALGSVVMLEMTRVLSYGRGKVALGPIDHAKRTQPYGYDFSPLHWSCNVDPEFLGENLAYNRHFRFHEPGGVWDHARKFSEDFVGNVVTMNGTKYGVIGAGTPYLSGRYAAKQLKLQDEISWFKLGSLNPFPEVKLRNFLASVQNVLILEEIEPMIETFIRDMVADMDTHAKIFGKKTGHIKICGSVDSEEATKGLVKMMDIKDYLPHYTPERRREFDSLIKEEIVHRPQGYFCPGCPEMMGIYEANRVARRLYGDDNFICHGDIGCFEHGHSAPWRFEQSVMCMGAGPSLGGGNYHSGIGVKVISCLGDSTFFHAGMPALANSVYNKCDITYLIYDNRCTASTGHQPHPGAFAVTAMDEPTELIAIEDVCAALGVKFIKITDPYNVEESQKICEEAYKFPGVSVVIFRRTCAVLRERQLGGKAKAQYKLYAIDPKKCSFTTGAAYECLTCVKWMGCPSIMRDGQNLYIEPDLCIGCGTCAQVCTSGAIHEVERGVK